MPHDGQIVGGAESARAAADDGDFFARSGRALRHGNRLFVFHGVALKPADVDGIVHQRAAAAGLAGMFADHAAHGGQRIVLADQLHGVAVPAGVDQGNVAGNVHVRGAQRDAGHGLVLQAHAAAVRDVLDKVVAEAAHALEHHAGGFLPDGAVRSEVDALGRPLDGVDGAHVGAAVQNGIEKFFQTAEADAAGNALAARLRVADVQKRNGQIDRTQFGRTGLNAAFHVLVQAFDGRLRLIFCDDAESAHDSSPCFGKYAFSPAPPNFRFKACCFLRKRSFSPSLQKTVI